jgi:hypothetical protein
VEGKRGVSQGRQLVSALHPTSDFQGFLGPEVSAIDPYQMSFMPSWISRGLTNKPLIFPNDESKIICGDPHCV